ncbi:MAG: RluA family pseudouridine synthase [Sporomusaceae bacterium]|nr:RluA family pseudouridine synthase [Sporomusaceae bacterium]
MRLDIFLAAKMPQYSRSYLQKLINGSNVVINEKPGKANYKLRLNDLIEVFLPDNEPIEAAPENIALDILYEDSEIIIINKQRGLVVHPAAGNYSGTLVNALLNHCHDLSGINGALRPGIVHRLDKDTSGVMVAAKSDLAHASLAAQIKSRTASRLYLAIAHGHFAEKAGIINAPIGRHATDRKKMAVTFKNSKEAITNFTVREYLYEENTAQKYTLVECKLATGRTHQIRVHLSHIGHPLVGDPKYGGARNCFKINGQALHSYQLKLTHPLTGKEMSFTAPLPADMLAIYQKLTRIE